jgi:pimeloyl-ACP methyl ester carboxylesterase
MSEKTSGFFEHEGARIAWARDQRASDRVICAAHPSEEFGAGTASLLADVTGDSVVCVSPSSARLSLEQMVEQVDVVRRGLRVPRWYFWGMSGGGWLSQIYARRYPEALLGIVIESVCACFRARIADPACAFSPYFPAWVEALDALGLIGRTAHAHPSSGDDTEWIALDGIGPVFRRKSGPALLVSPVAISDRMRDVMPRLWEFDARGWLGELRVPALVMCGTADPVVPIAHARRVHEAIPGSKFVLIEGGGHVPTVEKRPEITQAWQAMVKR